MKGKTFLHGPRGDLSSGRLMTLLALAEALFYTNFQMVTGGTIDPAILTIWISGAFGGHIGYKFAERGRGREPSEQAQAGNAGKGDNQGTPQGNGDSRDGGMGR